jgi:alpha-ribazole phosphatase
LNEPGKIQARAAAQRLLAEKIDLVFSSDLLRALETSRAIAGVHHAGVKILPALREINFGVWEGLTFAEIQTRYPVLFNDWLIDPLRVRIPAGETAEEVRLRVIEAWDSIVLNACGKGAVVIVAHGGPLRMLLCQLTGLDASRQWEFNLGHGEIIALRQNGDLYSITE